MQRQSLQVAASDSAPTNVLNQLMLEKLTALAALKRMREPWARPQYEALALGALLEKRGLPQTPAHLRDVVALI